MSSDEPDAKVEAATRLLISDLDRVLCRLLVAARKLRERNAHHLKKVNALTEEIVGDWTLIRERLDEQTLQSLDEETRGELRRVLGKSEHEISGEAVRRELRLKHHDDFDRLRGMFYGRAHTVASQRFRPFAKILTDDLVRRKITQAIMAAPSLCEALGPSETADFGRWLLTELGRIADEEITATNSEGRTTEAKAATRIPDKTVAPAAFSQPTETGTPIAAGENPSLIQRIQSSRTKPLTTLIGLVKSANPELDETRALLVASDKQIADIRSEAEQKRCYREVHDSVPDGWKDGIGEQKTLVAYWDKRDPKERGPIKSYVSRASSHLRQIVM